MSHDINEPHATFKAKWWSLIELSWIFKPKRTKVVLLKYQIWYFFICIKSWSGVIFPYKNSIDFNT